MKIEIDGKTLFIFNRDTAQGQFHNLAGPGHGIGGDKIKTVFSRL